MTVQRNSSFELLRIILIVMILVEHGNMWFIGLGYHGGGEYFVRCLVQSICIGAVNAFVLISGWFGINNCLAKMGRLLFMLLFCTLPLLVPALIFCWIPFSAVSSIQGVYQYVLGGNNYWFVVDYVGLLIFAPVLNNGIKTLSKRQLAIIILLCYCLFFIYDFALKTEVLGSEGGYSLLWFIFLYLFARYMRLYDIQNTGRLCWWFLIGSIIVQTVLFYYGLIGLRYTNPLILIEAVCMILIIRRYNFTNKIVNYASSACLMAYLLHMQPILIPYIRHYLFCEYAVHGYWLYLPQIILLSIAVLIVAIPIQRLSMWCYSLLKL